LFTSLNGDTSVVVVDTIAATPLAVPAETPQRVAPPPHDGATVPSAKRLGAAFAVGEALVLQMRRKYGAPFVSEPIARQRTTVPELVGLEVEDSVTSYALSVNDGGVLSTVNVVVAVSADTLLNWCVPASNKKATTNTIIPVSAVRMVIFPAVFINFGNSDCLYNI
jgi:hypothetical protein